MFHFPALSSSTYGFSRGYPGISQGGFPHSEISGSKPVCGSPKLIAAYHVLHRLAVPNYPPMTLNSLTKLSKKLSRLKIALPKKQKNINTVVKEHMIYAPCVKTNFFKDSPTLMRHHFHTYSPHASVVETRGIAYFTSQKLGCAGPPAHSRTV